MLCDVSYFTAGARHVLNATLGDESTEANDCIEAYIADWQEPFLCEAVGSALGIELHSYLVTLDEDENAEHDEAFDAVCKRLAQPFADYVFFRMLGETPDQATITGVKQLSDPNKYVSPLTRQVSTWNRMVERMKLFSEWSASGACPLGGVTVDENLLTPINRMNL